MKRSIGIGLIAVALCALAPVTYALLYVFPIELSGADEVPPADPDGWGSGTVTITPSTNAIRSNFVADNILVPLTGAHIHHDPAGQNGGVVFNFNAMFSGSGSSPVAQGIVASPSPECA